MTGAIHEFTPHFQLEIPEFDFPGWHTYYSRNLKTIDNIMYLMTGSSNLSGAWQNNRLYLIGERVVDIDIGAVYECTVQHTSAPAPTTFGQDRVAHPNYWVPISAIQSLVGTSSSSVTIGSGTKVFETQVDRVFYAGTKILAASAANPTVDYMWGTSTGYDGNTLTMLSEVPHGSGTKNDWILTVSGERGAKGDTGAQGIPGVPEEAPPNSIIHGRKNTGALASWVQLPGISVGDVTPTDAINGRLWWESDQGILWLYYDDGTSAQWVEVGGRGVPTITDMSASFVLKAGDTMTGQLTVGAPLHVEPAAGDVRLRLVRPTTGVEATISSRIGTLNRWVMNVGTNEPETGADAGSNFSLARYNDAGNILGFALQINRATGATALLSTVASTSPATGALTVAGGLGVGGHIAASGYIASGVNPTIGPGYGNTTVGCNMASGQLYTSFSSSGAFFSNINTDGANTIYCRSGITVGNVSVTTTSTAYNTSSDASLKEDLKAFDAGSIIDNTNVYDFAWKSTKERAFGVIAQQAIDVYPLAITHTEASVEKGAERDEWWGVDYSKYVPVLLQELKSLRARVAELENANTITPKRK